VTLNAAIWDRACTDLGMAEGDRPQVVFFPTRGKGNLAGKAMGVYYTAPLDSIEIYTGWEQYERDRLMSAMNELGRTLLHELRHAWQHRTWPKADLGDVVKKEGDARAYEDEAIARYRGIVRVTRKQHNSPFSRLGAAQARVRPGV
jgi:hypothetical protein